MRGVAAEPDAGVLPPPPSDAGAAPEVASGTDASNRPQVDSGGNSDGGNSSDATLASCADLPPGIFPSNGVTCLVVDPKPGQPVCVADPSGDDGPTYLEFVGCIQGKPATTESICSNGMCCQRLPTSFFSTPGSVCPIASGMQIVAYGQPLDTDQDFFPDYRDNCPYVANTFGQGDDDDGDGIGNACDPCPAVPGITCDAGATPRASCADLLPGIFPPNGAACQPVDPRAGLSPQPFCVPNQGGADGPLSLDFVGCKRGPSEMEGAPCSNGVCCYWIETMAYAGAPGDACAYAGGMDIVAYGEALDTDQDGIPDYQEPCPEVPGVTCTDARTP